MIRVVIAAALVALAGTFAASGDASPVIQTAATIPLRTALTDPWIYMGGDATTAFQVTRASGASSVVLIANWSSIAPTIRPAGFDAADPASPGYNWGGLDSQVNGAVSAGLTPILDVHRAPRWALVVPPRGVNAGSPGPGQLGLFARALALHYDGSHGEPAVHAFQVWNEPNLSTEMSPVNPSAYRNMVNQFAKAVHGVDPANLVVAGGLDPFGNTYVNKQDPSKSWNVMAPLAFMRALLCVAPGTVLRPSCKQGIRFDVWSHHPYTFNGPTGHAARRDDVSLGDLPEMDAVLQAGIGFHRVLSTQPVQFWVTEFGWDTNPPRPHAVPLDLEARWTAEALHQMWLSGVSLVTWFLVRDQPGTSPYQSGLYFSGTPLAQAKAKPMATSFRFPFVAYLQRDPVTHAAEVAFWGRDATSQSATVAVQACDGPVVLQACHGTTGSWATVAYIRTNEYGIFQATVPLPSATTGYWLRAWAAGSGFSLPFSLTVPPAQRYGPWGN